MLSVLLSSCTCTSYWLSSVPPAQDCSSLAPVSCAFHHVCCVIQTGSTKRTHPMIATLSMSSTMCLVSTSASLFCCNGFSCAAPQLRLLTSCPCPHIFGCIATPRHSSARPFPPWRQFRLRNRNRAPRLKMGLIQHGFVCICEIIDCSRTPWTLTLCILHEFAARICASRHLNVSS
jgi:hypothetical protein